MRSLLKLCALLAPLALPVAAHADATTPIKDIAGAKDVPGVKRYEGSFIVSYNRKSFGELTVPTAVIEPVPDKRDYMNNRKFAAKSNVELEGAVTRLVYAVPVDRSPLEVVRNYEAEAKAAGGEVLFTCKGDACGGDAGRGVSGGGSSQSLAMQFLPQRDVKDAPFSNGYCALISGISDQRYSVMRVPVPGGDMHIAVLAWQIDGGNYCKALAPHTIAMVHVIEPKGREQKMVTVNAAEMARSLESTGRIALYGIYFDTNKAEVKPDSATTLAEIGKLLKDSPKLSVLIVGHTDNVGEFAYNTDLSKRRAEAVVAALAKQYGVPAARMRGVGVGMVAPVASNDNEEGRAKNRRVELVKLN